MELDPAISFQHTLARAKEADKSVALLLRNGSNLAGRVGAVGDHYVVLTELTGREFYDAQILIEDISAIEVRVR